MSKEPTALDRAAASVGLFDWGRATKLLGGGSYAENTALAALQELAKAIVSRDEIRDEAFEEAAAACIFPEEYKTNPCAEGMYIGAKMDQISIRNLKSKKEL